MNILISILLLVSAIINISAQQKCDVNELRHVDSTVAKIITIGNSGRKFPENKQNELKKYCNDTSVFMKQVNDYKTRCLKNLPKQLVGVIIYSMNNQLSQLCRKDSKRLDDLIQSTPCINRANPELNKCYTRYIDALLGAKNEVDDTKKIPYNCCAYYQLFPCFESRMKRIRECTPFHIQTTIDFVRSLFGDVINLICTDYTDETDKCKRLGSPPRKRKNQRRSKSFVIPYLELFASFKEV